MTVQRLMKAGLFSLIGLEIALGLAYLLAVMGNRPAPHWLDLNGLRSLPSLLQAAHLFTIGLIALALLWRRHQQPHSLSWFLPLALALLCFYGTLDELTKIHLHLRQYNWKVIYLGLLVAIPLVSWRDLIWIWRSHRSTVLWVLAGLSIFLLGGFGAEAMKTTLHHRVAADAEVVLAGRVNHLPDLAEHVRVAVEESAELLGETLILFGFAQFALVWLRPSPPSRG